MLKTPCTLLLLVLVSLSDFTFAYFTSNHTLCKECESKWRKAHPEHVHHWIICDLKCETMFAVNEESEAALAEAEKAIPDLGFSHEPEAFYIWIGKNDSDEPTHYV
jgi:hypothetical protein